MQHVLTILLIGLALADASEAQPIGRLSPSTLFFENGDVPSNDLFLANIGSDTLLVDSMWFSKANPYFWGLEISNTDSTFELGFNIGLVIESAFPTFHIAPGDSTRITFQHWDSCVICKAQSDDLGAVDTLTISTNDPTSPYQTALFDNAFYVGLGEPSTEENRLSLDVFPNPSTAAATIQLSSGFPGDIEIAIYNVLGQLVSSRTLQISQGYVNATVSTEGMSKGAYYVTARSAAGSVTEKLIVN